MAGGTGKITLFFQQYNYGWTESLWKAYATSIADLLTPAAQLAVNALSLRGAGISITTIRVSDDIFYRDSLYVPTSYYTGTDAPAYIPQNTSLQQVKSIYDPNLPAQNAYDAVQIRMESGPVYRREAYFRGMPAGIFTNPPGPNFNLIANYPQAWLTYQQYITNPANGWLFRVKADGVFNTVNYAKQVVTAITGPTPWQVTVPGGTFAVGNYIQLVGFKGQTGVRGKYFVQSVTSTPLGQVLLLTGNLQPKANITTPQGYAQLLSVTGAVPQPAYVPITSAIVRTQTRKSTGRPTFGPRGRQRAHLAASS